MIWEVTGKVKTKQVMIPFLAKGSFAFRKIDAQRRGRREWLKESEELSLRLEIRQQLKGSGISSLPSSSSGGNISVDAQTAGAHSALKSLTKEVTSLRMETGHLDTEGTKRGKQKANDKRGRKDLRTVFITLTPIQNILKYRDPNNSSP